MSSRITPATMTVTITEAITLNGSAMGATNALSLPSIGEIITRIMSVPSASEIKIMSLGAAAAAGVLDRAKLKYLRITNLDNSVEARIRIADTDSNEMADFKLLPGHSFLLGQAVISAQVGAGAFSAWEDIEDISAQGISADVDIEIYAAMT